MTERVRQVVAEFVPPEGATEHEAAQLRQDAVRRAMFDSSKEATLARKYEAAAERSFLRCLKELRQLERQARGGSRAAYHGPMPAGMASFLDDPEADDQVDAIYALLNLPRPKPPLKSSRTPTIPTGIDVPIAVGRRS